MAYSTTEKKSETKLKMKKLRLSWGSYSWGSSESATTEARKETEQRRNIYNEGENVASTSDEFKQRQKKMRKLIAKDCDAGITEKQTMASQKLPMGPKKKVQTLVEKSCVVTAQDTYPKDPMKTLKRSIENPGVAATQATPPRDPRKKLVKSVEVCCFTESMKKPKKDKIFKVCDTYKVTKMRKADRTEKQVNFSVDSSHSERDDANAQNDGRVISGLYSCQVCTMKFTEIEVLEEHFKAHANVHVCAFCNTKFLHEDEFKLHLDNHLGQQEHNKLKQDGESLWKSSVDPEDDYIMQLTNENKSVHNSSELSSTVHSESTLNPGSYDDGSIVHQSTCSSMLETLDKPDYHAKSHTSHMNQAEGMLINSSINEYACVVCQESFAEVDKLYKHTLIHSGARPHCCNKCNKSFATSDSLKKHKLIHSGSRFNVSVVCLKPSDIIKPYKCDVCGKSYTKFGHLTRHKPIHSQSCNVCAK